MKKNVLIFSGGSYPAIQIYYCLQHSKLFNPIAASSYSDHARFVFREYVDNLPYVYEPEFVNRLNLLIAERSISFIIPTHDTIAMFLMEHQHLIDAIVVCSPYETAFMCRYKSNTYEHLKDCHFTPLVYKSVDDVKQYPVFVKPDDGQGGQGAVIVNDEPRLREVINNGRNMVICEYLNGEELTIDCFTDRYRKLRFVNPRQRTRVMYGVSMRGTRTELFHEIERIIIEINEKIIFRGYWFVQLKRNANGQYKLLEICTRFSGTFGLSKSLDVNLPLLALCDFSGMDISITPNQYDIRSDKTFIDRYEINLSYDRIYIDYDDTVTSENGKAINSFIVAFLYQCRNKNKHIVLITKHTSKHSGGSVRDDMKQFALSPDIFDEIIELTSEQRKIDFINNNIPSIFIDNSYAERLMVKQFLGMATFDVSNIDCLLDWR